MTKGFSAVESPVVVLTGHELIHMAIALVDADAPTDDNTVIILDRRHGVVRVLFD